MYNTAIELGTYFIRRIKIKHNNSQFIQHKAHTHTFRGTIPVNLSCTQNTIHNKYVQDNQQLLTHAKKAHWTDTLSHLHFSPIQEQTKTYIRCINIYFHDPNRKNAYIHSTADTRTHKDTIHTPFIQKTTNRSHCIHTHKQTIIGKNILSTFKLSTTYPHISRLVRNLKRNKTLLSNSPQIITKFNHRRTKSFLMSTFKRSALHGLKFD